VKKATAGWGERKQITITRWLISDRRGESEHTALGRAENMAEAVSAGLYRRTGADLAGLHLHAVEDDGHGEHHAAVTAMASEGKPTADSTTAGHHE